MLLPTTNGFTPPLPPVLLYRAPGDDLLAGQRAGRLDVPESLSTFTSSPESPSAAPSLAPPSGMFIW